VTFLDSFGLALTVASLFAYANQRWLRVPAAVGFMAMALITSLLLIGIDRLGWLPLSATAGRVVERIDFNEALMHGMLGALLFAGALHIDVGDLRREGVPILSLAAGGTVLSTFLVSTLVYYLSSAVGPPLSFAHCMLFGALISPTDPVAVLSVLRVAGVSKKLEMQIAGESLFNDGVGVVIFVTILAVVTQSGPVHAVSVVSFFVREALGGAAFGLGTGWIAYHLLRSIDHYQTELLITLALVFGGYALAERIHVSAPIAAVVSGLIIGNAGRAHAMSDVTRDHLDKFWELVDEVLNALLFVLMGFEVIRLSLHGQALLLGVGAIAIVLAARAASVGLFVMALRRTGWFERGSWAVLTWGGLRGGISVALALSLARSAEREVTITLTYVVVIFSVLVQALTVGRLARRFAVGGDPPTSVHPWRWR
jgi:CPA1 family monovalent cation:H+ antiporter